MLKNLFACYQSQNSSDLIQVFGQDFKTVDKLVLIVIVAYAVTVVALTSQQHGYYLLGLTAGGVTCLVCGIAYFSMGGSVMSRIILATGLTVFMAVTVQQANGLGEGHFIFFVNIMILSRYRDVVPLLVLMLLTAGHHLISTVCQINGVQLFGQELIIFAWGQETSLGLWAPFLYHIFIAAVSFCIACYFISEGTQRFIETNQVIHLVEQASDGNVFARISDPEDSDLAKRTNHFLHNVNQTLIAVETIGSKLVNQSNELNRSSVNLATAAKEQRADVKLVNSAIQEMALATSEISENSEETSSCSQECVQFAKLGVTESGGFKNTIDELSNEVATASSVMSQIELDGEKINSIVDTIRSIAEQTNLLALNAAIEAARAGDQGRGFAVVADEVRVLSQRTYISTDEISTMIKSFSGLTKRAADSMENCNQLAITSVTGAERILKHFSGIGEEIGSINQRLEQIASAAEEQATSNIEIRNKSATIQEKVISFLEESEQIQRQAQSLTNQVQEIQQLLKQFKLHG